MKPKKWFAPYLPSPGQESGRNRQGILILIPILLAIVLLYFALRDLDWAVFIASLGQGAYAFLPVFLIGTSFCYLLRAIRWRLLIQESSPTSLREVFWANMAGYLGNNILPARAGELVRAVYVSKRTNRNLSSVLATCLGERIMDVLALIIFGSAALLWLGIESVTLRFAIGVSASVGFLGFLGLVVVLRAQGAIRRLVSRQPWLRDGQKEKITRWIEQFTQGLQSILHPRKLFFFGLFTVLIWCLDAMNMVFLAFLLHIRLAFTQSIVFLASLGLSSAIPSTPGYVGVYQFVAVTVLGPFGISIESALSLILIAQISNLLLVSILGGIGLWRVRG